MVGTMTETGYLSPITAIPEDAKTDYLNAMSMTLEIMGKLLIRKKEKIPNGINILGCNPADWTDEMLQDTECWLQSLGYQVISRWGVTERTEALSQAASASLNLVVNISGLRLAKYMKKEFGIRYVVGAPYGHVHCTWIQNGLLTGGRLWSAGIGGEEEPLILFVGEQLMGNALRRVLYVKGYEGVKVASFFEMDHSQMSPGDEKLNSQEDLKRLLNTKGLQLIIADEIYKSFLEKKVAWIHIPKQGMNHEGEYSKPDNINLIGDCMDRWLEKELERAGFV